MTLPGIAAALRDVHLSISQQHELTKVVIQNAESARAEFRTLTAGAANPLVNRVLGNYAQGIVKLRDGSWLLAEAGGILAEYARAIGVDIPAHQPSDDRRTLNPVPDGRAEPRPGLPGQRAAQKDEPSRPDAQS
ncbi:hypothetical protein [Micromonospora globbae]|uniref:Uncharacterized protein n=1 Tax=Micromonospora globbae TaxID=1894969 RepID=A0A420ET75_9ACTN|nr:hypothetical protein [Micromonospora globbae]RKF23859.1 hypothetical protein D7I43_29065 [Micromonospora globbae]